jgi:hypothetical protein
MHKKWVTVSGRFLRSKGDREETDTLSTIPKSGSSMNQRQTEKRVFGDRNVPATALITRFNEDYGKDVICPSTLPFSLKKFELGRSDLSKMA